MPIDELFRILWDLLAKAQAWAEMAAWSVNVLLDLGLHFLWGAALGSLALFLTYYSMRTLWRFLAAQRHLPASLRAAGEGHIWSFSWCSGLFVAWLSHCWWDGLLII